MEISLKVFQVNKSTGISFFLFLLVPLQFDGGPFAAPDVPHDDGVVRAAGEQNPLNWIPAERRHVTWSSTHQHMGGFINTEDVAIINNPKRKEWN